MSTNLANKLNTGISPKQFMDGMQKNKEKFQEWYDQYEWDNEEDRAFFESLNNRDDLRCVVIAADWCGDVVRNLPVVFHATACGGIPTEVLILEQNLDVIDQFLTLGGRSIPTIIFTDTGGFVLGRWGPRPQHVQAPMVRFKQENPDPSADDYAGNLQVARAEIREQYGEGRGYQAYIIRELRELLASF